ncbi:hypothetical protein FOZ61_009248 [Perkinsus olseni]|uniref:tRNA (adenine(58)-N(1))-methyltransferase non-catalytic subunit TRM6 n=1 Tax=Perkinsus olseni TaxID=32597 RepID=A0A7J6L7I6_PEROL|nr:hypothetical protein FOZ61_009248 [Perkinsus olseni]KAF4655142.1 hypothetical protein FOL46_008377 [Perkinsus olseni]
MATLRLPTTAAGDDKGWDKIDYGKSVIVRASDGSAKVVRIPKAPRSDAGNDGEHSPKGKKPRPKRQDNVKIGKTVVPVSALIGRRYGSTIHHSGGDGWVRSQCSKVSTSEDAAVEIDTTVNNQFLEQSSEDNQPDIGASSAADAALKSKTFEMKTQFSQEKYLRKKQKKYLREVTLLPLNLFNYCHYAPGAANGPRFDLVGSILRHTSHCSSLVVWDDSCGGLITAAALQRGQKVERLARGRGTTPDAAVTELGIPGEVVGALLSKTQLVEAEGIEEEKGKQDDEVGSDGLRHYHKHSTKRSVVGNPVINPDGGVMVWMDLAISGSTKEFFEVASVVMEQISPYCGTLVVLARHMDLVQQLQRQLIKLPQWINVTLTEPIVREHQVLPNRTHPIMQSATNSAQGFILTAIKVVTAAEDKLVQDGVAENEEEAKKAKTEP